MCPSSGLIDLIPIFGNRQSLSFLKSPDWVRSSRPLRRFFLSFLIRTGGIARRIPNETRALEFQSTRGQAYRIRTRSLETVRNRIRVRRNLGKGMREWAQEVAKVADIAWYWSRVSGRNPWSRFSEKILNILWRSRMRSRIQAIAEPSPDARKEGGHLATPHED